MLILIKWFERWSCIVEFYCIIVLYFTACVNFKVDLTKTIPMSITIHMFVRSSATGKKLIWLRVYPCCMQGIYEARLAFCLWLDPTQCIQCSYIFSIQVLSLQNIRKICDRKKNRTLDEKFVPYSLCNQTNKYSKSMFWTLSL